MNVTVSVTNLFLYADDSTLMVSDKNTGKVRQKLGEEVNKVSLWLLDYELLLHLDKPELISFGSKPKLHKNIQVGCQGWGLCYFKPPSTILPGLNILLDGQSSWTKIVEEIIFRPSSVSLRICQKLMDV